MMTGKSYAAVTHDQDTAITFWLLHLYAKLQKKNIESVHIKGSIQPFEQDIEKIR